MVVLGVVVKVTVFGLVWPEGVCLVNVVVGVGGVDIFDFVIWFVIIVVDLVVVVVVVVVVVGKGVGGGVFCIP